VPFDNKFFTPGELVPLGDFIKQQSYLGLQASSFYFFVDLLLVHVL